MKEEIHMRVSYKWLQNYIDLEGVTAEDLAEKLTRAGIEVEVVHKRNEGISNVVIGYVQERKQHPNADKLSLCLVDLGEEEPVQIVCGAPNVDQGQKVPVAKIGAVLPGNFKIKKSKLRGEVSQGMICSAQELGIEERLVAPEFKDGIMVLPNDYPVGEDALALLDLDDEVLELELTPNRADCLSMLGVAYEVAAILDREVKLPQIELAEHADSIDSHVSIELKADDLCPYYVARKVTNVKIGPSPMWLQNRLIAANIRPINNVVDVTNYVLLEYGQPLHAFDASKVKDGHIVVREADAGEEVVTLDDQERTLEAGTLVIADPEKVIAVAGVMGAANSEVSDETTDIIIESAYFNGQSIRKTSKTLGLRSEASTRFEKGIDPERVVEAADRAAQLLAQLADGSVLQGTAEARTQSFDRKDVALNMVNLNKVLGINLNTQQVAKIMDRLSFDYENLGHEISVDVPTRRPDITIEEDLIEEVARLHGYDNIPTTLPEGLTTPGSRTKRQRVRRLIKKYLQGAGLNQVVTYSLTSEANAQLGSLFVKNVHPIKLAMPMSEERSHLRTSIIPNLLEVAHYNQNRKLTNTHIFELGGTFLTQQQEIRELPDEQEVVSGLITGLWEAHPWQQVKVPVDFFVLKGIVEGLLDKLGITGAIFEKGEHEGFHPGRTACITHDGEMIGLMAQVHPEVENRLDLGETYAFELNLDALLNRLPEEISYSPIAKYPSIQRDIAIVVNQEVTANQLIETIKDVGAPLVTSVQLFDVYEGEHIEQGKKSMAFSLVYLNKERTMTDEEVQQVHERILLQLEQTWQADLRR